MMSGYGPTLYLQSMCTGPLMMKAVISVKGGCICVGADGVSGWINVCRVIVDDNNGEVAGMVDAMIGVSVGIMVCQLSSRWAKSLVYGDQE
ncbi:hypothetical protein Tco_0595795 [Tanacetum coccineum]